MNHDDVDILERRTVYDGYMRMEILRLRHRRHDGGRTGEISREVLERGHAVAVLPYDPVLDEVVLIEQFRVGAYGAGWNPWQVEIVAGVIEPGEAPDEVARRETLEECGCDVAELVPISEILTSPGITTETVAIYCGRTDAAGAGGVHGLDEEDEDIRAFAVPAHEAIAMMASGRICNSPAVIALQWLALNREELRKRWKEGR